MTIMTIQNIRNIPVARLPESC